VFGQRRIGSGCEYLCAGVAAATGDESARGARGLRSPTPADRGQEVSGR
jgi:hypothetical protein